MVRLLSFIFFAFVFSCTIIEDSDITSQEELDNLVFSAIEIRQEMSSGNTTSTATVTSIAVVNIPVSVPPFNGTLTKQVHMDWPALTANSKLKLKSGDVTPFKSRTSYLSSGQPYNFYLFHVSGSDTIIFEWYRFRYDANGRLSNIITNVPYVENTPATSRDTLIYETSGRLSSITRKYPATGTSTTFTNLFYKTSYNNSYNLNQFNFQGINYQNYTSCSGGGCGPYWGGNYHASPGTDPNSNNFPTGVMNLATFQMEYLSMQDFNSIGLICANKPCSAWIDTFYLHPLMILKDQLNAGDDLLFIYMVDWWQPVSTQESANNEKVTFTFK